MSRDSDSSPTSVADRLAAELEAGADFVDAGSIQIDMGRALDKLGNFQLGDPSHFVLHWVEAGLIAGVTALLIEVTVGRIHVAFVREGEPIVISPPVLERVLQVLLSGSPPTGAGIHGDGLAHLAVGILAAKRLAPDYLAIESVGADGRGARVVFGESDRMETLVQARPGTRLTLDRKVGLEAAIFSLVMSPKEVILLGERCKYAATPVFLNRQMISQKRVVRSPVVAGPVWWRGRVIGEAAFTFGRGAEAVCHILCRGLVIQRQRMVALKHDFISAIDVDLPRDLSRSRLTESPEVGECLAAVTAAHHRMWLEFEAIVRRKYSEGDLWAHYYLNS